MSPLATSTLSVAAYSILPYVALSVGIGGLIWRRKTDRFGWTARSTELLENRILRFASVLFHFGVLAAIGGHVLGILIPSRLPRRSDSRTRPTTCRPSSAASRPAWQSWLVLRP